MRALLLAAALFLAGYSAGRLAFSGSSLSISLLPRGESAHDSEGRTAVEAGGDSPDAKAQRLVVAVLRKGREIDRDAELYLAIEAFTAEDFRSLLIDIGALKAIAEKLRDIGPNRGEQLASALIGRWLTVDPASLETWAPRLLEIFPAGKGPREIIIDALAARRPEIVLAMLPSEKNSEAREQIITAALRELAGKDNAKAKTWLNACTNPKDRRIAEKAYRIGTVTADPLRAVELAGGPDGRRDEYDIMSAAAAAAAAQGTGTLRQLASMPMGSNMLAAVLSEFAERDPEMAVELALKTAPEKGDDGAQFALQHAFSALAARDPSQAVAKLEGLQGMELASAVAAVGAQWVGQDPQAAMEWLMSKPPSERTDPLSGSMGTSDALLMTFREWFSADDQAARTWADALPPGESRDQVQTHLARLLAYGGDPAAATRVLFQLGESADQEVFSDVARFWARSDPQAAADWAIAQPAGPMQARAVAGVVSGWANEDAAAVQQWLGQFPPGEVRDRSVATYLNRFNALYSGAERQEEFEAWFDLIEDPWLRGQAAVGNFQARYRTDPRAARDWLATLPNVDSGLIQQTLMNYEE